MTDANLFTWKFGDPMEADIGALIVGAAVTTAGGCYATNAAETGRCTFQKAAPILDNAQKISKVLVERATEVEAFGKLAAARTAQVDHFLTVTQICAQPLAAAIWITAALAESVLDKLKDKGDAPPCPESTS